METAELAGFFRWFLLFYFVGWQVTYLYLVRKFMRENGISSIKEASQEEQDFANLLFVGTMQFWWSHKRLTDFVNNRKPQREVRDEKSK